MKVSEIKRLKPIKSKAALRQEGVQPSLYGITHSAYFDQRVKQAGHRTKHLQQSSNTTQNKGLSVNKVSSNKQKGIAVKKKPSGQSKWVLVSEDESDFVVSDDDEPLPDTFDHNYILSDEEFKVQKKNILSKSQKRGVPVQQVKKSELEVELEQAIGGKRVESADSDKNRKTSPKKDYTSSLKKGHKAVFRGGNMTIIEKRVDQCEPRKKPQQQKSLTGSASSTLAATGARVLTAKPVEVQESISLADNGDKSYKSSSLSSMTSGDSGSSTADDKGPPEVRRELLDNPLFVKIDNYDHPISLSPSEEETKFQPETPSRFKFSSPSQEQKHSSFLHPTPYNQIARLPENIFKEKYPNESFELIVLSSDNEVDDRGRDSDYVNTFESADSEETGDEYDEQQDYSSDLQVDEGEGEGEGQDDEDDEDEAVVIRSRKRSRRIAKLSPTRIVDPLPKYLQPEEPLKTENVPTGTEDDKPEHLDPTKALEAARARAGIKIVTVPKRRKKSGQKNATSSSFKTTSSITSTEITSNTLLTSMHNIETASTPVDDLYGFAEGDATGYDLPASGDVRMLKQQFDNHIDNDEPSLFYNPISYDSDGSNDSDDSDMIELDEETFHRNRSQFSDADFDE